MNKLSKIAIWTIPVYNKRSLWHINEIICPESHIFFVVIKTVFMMVSLFTRWWFNPKLVAKAAPFAHNNSDTWVGTYIIQIITYVYTYSYIGSRVIVTNAIFVGRRLTLLIGWTEQCRLFLRSFNHVRRDRPDPTTNQYHRDIREPPDPKDYRYCLL